MALALERPPGDTLAVEFDRLSVVHLALFALLALFVWLCPTNVTWPSHRLGLALAAAGSAISIMGLWVPDILAGPMAAMDPVVREVWFRNNAEVSPILMLFDLRSTGPKTVAHLGLAIIAVFAMLPVLPRSTGETRLNWGVLAVFLVACFAMSFREARWSGYAQILSLPPVISAMQLLFARFPGRAGLRIVMVIFLAAGPLIASGLLRQALPWQIGDTPVTCRTWRGF